MNPELLHMAAQRHYQDRIRAAHCEPRLERVHRASVLGQTIRNMRFHRRRRTLAIRTAALGGA